jgi:signal recognition particle receptor subunit beta
MAEISPKDKTIRVKIIYYGPALGGKTTNLRVLHKRAAQSRRGEMWSVNSFQDRTILFDLLPIQAVGPRGFDVRVQLLAVPGQAMYSASRRAALRGADGLVFVANSAEDRLDENVRSLREMNRYLLEHQLDPQRIPLVLQYNKRDLPRVLALPDLDRALNERRQTAVPAVAVNGQGVVETLSDILGRTILEVARRYKSLELSDQAAAFAWARSAVLGIFGTEALGPETVSPAPNEQVAAVAPRIIRVPVPESPGKGDADGERRTAEAYAEACTALAEALTEATEARDQGRSRLAEVRRAVEVANSWSAADLAGSIRRMLSCFAEAAEAAHASFVVWRERGGSELVRLPPFEADPLTASALGNGYLVRAAGRGVPFAEEAQDNLDLKAILEHSRPPLTGLAVVPVRLPSRVLGLALLYFTEDDRIPGEDLLQHLSLLSGVFVTPVALALMKPTPRVDATPTPSEGGLTR